MKKNKASILNYSLDKVLFILCLSAGLLCFFSMASKAQDFNLSEKSPRGAFLRSLVLPGWGHHYINKKDWKRGQFYMAADAIIILSYAGIRVRNNQLENELQTFALANAGIDLRNKNRDIFLAIANFDNLDVYNDFQIRSRNWDNLITDSVENRWNWVNDEDRFRYQDKREKIDKNSNQLPALITLMVANRVISGIGAFVKARNVNFKVPEARFSHLNEFGELGFTASLRFSL